MGIQMKVLRLSAAVLTASMWLACSASNTEPKSGGSKSGCPDEDPFCDESSSGDSGDSESGGSSEGESSGSGSTSDGGSSVFGGSEQVASIEDFDVVIRTNKPKEKPEGEAADDAKKEEEAKKKPKPQAKPKKPKDGQAVYKVVLHPKGMSFQMGSEQVAKLYERLFEKQYVEIYKKTPVGPQTKALDNELEEKKQILRRNLLEFGNLPSGLDNTPLKGEYSYANNESYTKIDLGNGIIRNFFFFNDSLWKIYDEHDTSQNKKSPLGGTFESAVAYIGEALGAPPKMVEPSPAMNRDFTEAEWRDGSTMVRVVDRLPIIGVVFVSESVQNQLPTLRKNKLRDPTAIDPAVQEVTGPYKPSELEGGKDKDKDKKKKK